MYCDKKYNPELPPKVAVRALRPQAHFSAPTRRTARRACGNKKIAKLQYRRLEAHCNEKSFLHPAF